MGTLIQNAESVLAAEIALTQAYVLVGNASGVAVGVAISGAITINASGVTTLGADAVATAANIADDAVSLEHLDAGITPGLMVIAAGIATTAGGDANESITATGCVGTDTAIVWVQKAGATPRMSIRSRQGTGSIAVVLSDDPLTDHKLAWTARAPA